MLAGYSDNREQNYELKYLRKVLGEVDDSIRVPDSVRGEALRHKLDNVYPAAPAAPNRKSGAQFGLRVVGLRPVMTYAAAFVLIVALFYGLGFDRRPDIVDGTMELPEQTEQMNIPESAQIVEFGLDISEDAPVDPPTGGGAAEAGGPQQTETDTAPRVFSEPLGVGGGGVSTTIGELDGYTYAWRNNDPTDPDKGDFPVTVEVIRDADAKVVSQIDLPDLLAVGGAYLDNGVLVLAGDMENGVVTRSYDLTDPEQPLEGIRMEQAGTYVGSRFHKGIVSTASLSETTEVLDCVVEVLPYASLESACVIASMDTATGVYSVKAFQGAEDDIALYDLSAYLTYTGSLEQADGEAAQSGPAVLSTVRIAQISLIGTEIELTSVS